MASLHKLSNEDDEEKFDNQYEESVVRRRQIKAQAKLLAKKYFKREKIKLKLLKEHFNKDVKLIVKEPEPPPKDPEPTKKSFSKEDIQSYVESIMTENWLHSVHSKVKPTEHPKNLENIWSKQPHPNSFMSRQNSESHLSATHTPIPTEFGV